jgi:hypothetical protein
MLIDPSLFKTISTEEGDKAGLGPSVHCFLPMHPINFQDRTYAFLVSSNVLLNGLFKRFPEARSRKFTAEHIKYFADRDCFVEYAIVPAGGAIFWDDRTLFFEAPSVTSGKYAGGHFSGLHVSYRPLVASSDLTEKPLLKIGQAVLPPATELDAVLERNAPMLAEKTLAYLRKLETGPDAMLLSFSKNEDFPVRSPVMKPLNELTKRQLALIGYFPQVAEFLKARIEEHTANLCTSLAPL